MKMTNRTQIVSRIWDMVSEAEDLVHFEWMLHEYTKRLQKDKVIGKIGN